MSKQKTNEGIFSAAEKFTNAFFKGLENNTANRFIKKAEKAKLPPEAIKLMKDLENNSKRLKDAMKKL